MFIPIARFELAYQLRNPVLWISFGLFFLLTFGAVTVDEIQIGSGGNTLVNSPFAILQTVLIMSIFANFALVAFVANGVLRDDETGFGPIVRATRMGKGAYLFGRFAGAFLAGLIGFAAVPLAMMLGSMMPWLDPETLGPFRPDHYLFAYAVLAAPTLFIFGASFFALATLTRSAMATYVGLIAFLAAYLVMSGLLTRPDQETLSAMLDPVGAASLFQATKYWTAVERNTLLPPITGLFLANRALWLGIAVVFLAAAYVFFRFEGRGAKAAKARKSKKTQPPAHTGALPAPRFGADAAWAQARARTAFDMKAVFASPAYAVLLLIGLFNAGSSLWFADEFRGATTLPVTRIMVEALNSTFTIIPIIIATYYAGDLVWRERARRMHEIIDSTPVADWAFVLPKIAAIALVLMSTSLVGVLAAVVVQTLKGYTDFELMNYGLWYVLPTSVTSIQLAVLAVFFQSVSPNKFVGWGLMVLYLVASITFASLGFEHNLYNFGGSPGVPLSDMNGMGHFWQARAWFDAYWTAFCLVLVVVSYGLWRRGTETRLLPRLKRLPRRLAGVPGVIMSTGLVTFTGLGGWIYYNTNILNTYQTTIDEERTLAEGEITLKAFIDTPQPTITRVELDVTLEPSNLRALTRGQYVVENKTGTPLREVHIFWQPELKMEDLAVEGAARKQSFDRFNYTIWAFDTPMQPGEERTITFLSRLEERGFPNARAQTRIVDNGSFINNLDISPQLGLDRSIFLQDRATRRKYGLAPAERMAKLEDQAANAHHYLRRDSDWVTSDITVTTDADQIPIAPGYQVSETRTEKTLARRFRTEAPIMHFFSIQSARYAVKREVSGPVTMEVYYHPEHGGNVDRMLKAMRESLSVFSEAFAPFQFRQMRVLEFPAYASFAQSFANTVPYSEAIGFIQSNRDPEKLDMVTFVTAHEIAHQWWAHHIIGADKQGSTMLSESFSQYSAMLVMERLYGPEHVRRFLSNELDSYLRARGTEVLEELPLIRVEDQPYIHYNKGALVMYFLRNEVGETVVNRSLQRLIEQFGFRNAPYPSSADFVRILREEAGPQHDALITDLFEKITLYDAKTLSATASRRTDGRWDLTLTVEARKFYADGQGVEKPAAFDEPFEFGVFAEDPSGSSFSKEDVVLFERRPVRDGVQTLTFTVAREPRFAGLDPYSKRIDRISDDNVLPVSLQ